MTELTYGLRELHWDTELFGMKMGEIIFRSGNDNDVFSEAKWQNTIESARRQSYQFLLCQLDTGCQPAAAFLTKQGAVIGDTLVTLELNLNPITEIAVATLELVPAQLQVEPAALADLDRICDIAATSFSHSRFFEDPRIDQAKARRFYPKWLRDSMGISERAFVLKDKTGGDPVLGFITLQDHEAERTIVIRLIAIAESQRGCGYGQVLMDWLIRDALQRGFARIQVGTQANNTAAIHLYEKNGFRRIAAKYRFHIWLDALNLNSASNFKNQPE